MRLHEYKSEKKLSFKKILIITVNTSHLNIPIYYESVHTVFLINILLFIWRLAIPGRVLGLPFADSISTGLLFNKRWWWWWYNVKHSEELFRWHSWRFLPKWWWVSRSVYKNRLNDYIVRVQIKGQSSVRINIGWMVDSEWLYFKKAENIYGSISVSGQLRTYPSPNPTGYNKLIT